MSTDTSWWYRSTVGPEYVVLVSLALALIAGAAWWSARRRASRTKELVLRTSFALLVVALIKLPFCIAIHGGFEAPSAFMAPLDRLFATLSLLALALMLVVQDDQRRPKWALLGAMVAAVMAWGIWAPLWAAELGSVAAAGAAGGISVTWDLTLALAALALAVVLVVRRDAPRWLVVVVGALALGSALDAFLPMTSEAALWSRIGHLLAIGGLGAVVVMDELTVGTSSGSSLPAVDRLRRIVGLRMPQTRRTERAGPDGRSHWSADSAGESGSGAVAGGGRLEARAAAIRRALNGVQTRLDAGPAVALLHRQEDMEAWAAQADGDVRRLGRLPLERLTTIRRALREGPQMLEASVDRRDIDELYGLLGVPHDGPVLIVNIGRPPRGVLVLGRERTPWPEGAVAEATSIARRLDRALHALPSADGEAGGRTAVDQPRLLHALEGHAAALDRLARRIDAMDQRVRSLESDRDHPASGEERQELARYRKMLAQVPWGVVLADPDGDVTYANLAARRLLDVAESAPDRSLVSLLGGSDAVRRALVHLTDDREPAAGDPPPATRFSLGTPAVEVELEAISSPDTGRLGIMAVVEPVSVGGRTIGPVLMEQLIEAVREPMKHVMFHRELLARQAQSASPDVVRYMDDVDAHVNRMAVRLTDLVTAHQLDGGRLTIDPEPIALGEIVREALERSRPTIEAKAIRVTREVPEDLPMVLADHDALTHVLDNLVSTTVHRSGHGARMIFRAARAAVSDDADPEAGTVPAPAESSDGADPQAHQEWAVVSIQYRDWREHDRSADEFGGEDASAEPALRLARILTEVQGGRVAFRRIDAKQAQLEVAFPVADGGDADGPDADDDTTRAGDGSPAHEGTAPAGAAGEAQ